MRREDHFKRALDDEAGHVRDQIAQLNAEIERRRKSYRREVFLYYAVGSLFVAACAIGVLTLLVWGKP